VAIFSDSPGPSTEANRGARAMTRRLALTALPPPGTKRWVARRKAAVVAAVSGGQITLEEACRRYQLSEEEFSSWQRAFERYGVHALRATRLQHYRSADSSRSTRSGSSMAAPAQKGFDPSVEVGSHGR
jgi:transposase-like protein